MYSLRQAHCTNPQSQIVLVAEEKAWQEFLLAVASDDGDEAAMESWVHFVPLDTLRTASSKHRMLNSLSPFRKRSNRLWHTAVERLAVSLALFDLGVIHYEVGAYVQCGITAALG